ncbi:MAG: DUF1064 domain-containing protein [Methylocella sp.]
MSDAGNTISSVQYRALAAPAKRGRFGVSPVTERTVDGLVFSSKREARRYAILKQMERVGEITHLECQPAFDIMINGVKFCTYTADFGYFRRGVVDRVIEDVKGRGKGGTAGDPAYRLRKRAAELYFGIRVTEVLK